MAQRWMKLYGVGLLGGDEAIEHRYSFKEREIIKLQYDLLTFVKLLLFFDFDPLKQKL